jgi:hypothetical protein
MLACYRKIMKENKRYLSRQTSVIDFFKKHSGTRAWPSVLLGILDDYTDGPSTLDEKVSSPKTVTCFLVQILKCLKRFFVSINIDFLLGHKLLPQNPSPF